MRNLNIKPCFAIVLALGLCASARAQTLNIQLTDSLAGVGKRLSRAYMEGHPGLKIQTTAGSLEAALDALDRKEAPIILLPRAIRYKEARACQEALGKRPDEYKIGVEGVAVYVNTANPVKALTYEELEAVFTGKYTNWKLVGGDDGAVNVYSQNTNAAWAELFRDEVLNGKPVVVSQVTAPAGAEPTQAVASDNQGIAIGPLAKLQGARPLEVKRVVSSTPVEPNQENISNRIYPITRYLYAYVGPLGTEPRMTAFVEWIRSEAGQQVIQQAGFYPLPAKLRSGR
ncbi:MAG TPA: substrate-binding domain-containing protein [Verrucomicrobiae bacterium]|nr:substrate-binding domain-containing protein [Verrucomicrobiae bacterium]